MCSKEELPENWIRKKSNSRPDKSYYFNTETGKSQWWNPADDQKIEKTKPSCQTNKKSKEKSAKERFKLSDRSKDLKKRKLKTPAQDRLQNLVEKNQVVAESVKNALITSEPKKSKNVESNSLLSTVKKYMQNVGKILKSSTETKKTKSSNILPTKSNKSETVTSNRATDDIPSIFALKTPAQERLKALQTHLAESNGNENSFADALSVFQMEFGISNRSVDVDLNGEAVEQPEEMEWETSILNQQSDDVPFKNLTNPAYIVPDTNIFLHSDTCLTHIIKNDRKNRILIPFAVLQELDALKSKRESESVFISAAHAIKFIYKHLKSKDQRIQGQKATEDNKHLLDVNGADDRILNCCLQVSNQSREVLLLTNDINLSNKAISSGIETMTSLEYLNKCKNL